MRAEGEVEKGTYGVSQSGGEEEAGDAGCSHGLEPSIYRDEKGTA